MSDLRDELRDALFFAAAKVARDAFNWAVDKIRTKAKEHGVDLSDKQLEEIVSAQFGAMFTAVTVMAASIERDARMLTDSELAFRNASNVTVVDDMGEAPEKDE